MSLHTSWARRYGTACVGILTEESREMHRLPSISAFPQWLQLHPLHDLPSEPTWRNCPELLQNNMLSAILQWIIISSSKLNAGIAMQVAKEMRQKVALIAQDHMAPHTTASHRKRRRCRKQDRWCRKPPATPLAPVQWDTKETTRRNWNNCRTCTRELYAGPASCPLWSPFISVGKQEMDFPVSVETCKRKKMFWEACKGASLRSTLVLPF